MKKIVGYKFEIIKADADDCRDEWWREYHVESPIYASESAARVALVLYKKRLLKEAKERNKEAINFQIDYEIRNGRSVNKFLCDAARSLMLNYKGVLDNIRAANITPVYVVDNPTDETFEFAYAC